MELLIDARDYEQDLNWLGTVVLVGMALFFSAFYGFFLLSELTAISSRNAPDPLFLCASILFAYLGLVAVLMVHGNIFRKPLKVFDEGLEVQPAWGFRKKFVNFSDFESIEFLVSTREWFPRGKCILRTKQGHLQSHERFNKKEGLDAFIERIRPILERNGYRLADKKEHKRYLAFIFKR